MATYKELHGIAVQDVSSDSTAAGEIFYNSSTNTFRSVVQTSAWSSASPLNVARAELMGAGTQTASLAMGGYQSPGSGTIANAEEWNGSGWSNATDMPAVKHKPATGGTQTAAFVAGGYPGNAGNVNTYEYDGSSWTNGGNLNTSRRALRGAGTLTAGLAMGGTTAPNTLTNKAAEYDGTSWTAANNMNRARTSTSSSQNGTQTDAKIYTGQTPAGTYTNTSEDYDGTTFATGANNSTPRKLGAGGGTGPTALLAAGNAPPNTTATEEFNVETTAVNVKTLTQS